MNKQSSIRDEIDLMDYIRPLLPRWKLLLLVFVLGGVASFFISRMLPKQYSSMASIYVQQSSGAMSILRNLPVPVASGSSSLNGYLVTLLQSQSMRISVIDRLQLRDNKKLFPKERPSIADTLEKLGSIVAVSESKSGGVIITVTTIDSQLAADIANTMLDLLSKYVVTASRKKADFTFVKLQETEDKLDVAEEKLMKFLESNDVAAIDEQTKQMIEALGLLDERLTSVEAEIKQVDSELENSGDMETLIGLEVRKRALVSSRDYIQSQRNDIRKKLAKLPEVAAKYAKLQREILILSKSFELLTEQYEMAQITQKGEDGDYQIIDRARPNPNKVAPRNGLNALLGAMLCLFVGCVLVNVKAQRSK